MKLFSWSVDAQSHQSIGLVIGQRPQEHGVDDAEERDVGADAEREAENGDEGEARRLEQLPGGVAEHGRHEELRSEPDAAESLAEL